MTTRARTITVIGALCVVPASFTLFGCSGRVDLARQQQSSSEDGGSQVGTGGAASQGAGGASAGGFAGSEMGGTAGDVGAGGMAGGAGAGGMAGGAGAGAAGGVGAGGDTGGTAGAAGAGGTGANVWTCDLSCVTLDLRASPEASVFPVPPGVDVTDCFSFHVPSSAYSRAKAFAPIVGNQFAIHDMTLFKMSTPQVDGTSSQCLSSHPDGTAVWSWSPGMAPVSADVELAPGDFILEVHYANYTTQDQSDSSGVRLCACPE